MVDQRLFTDQDYRIVRAAMARLSRREFNIVFLRFWGRQTLVEIARELRLNFEAVDAALSVALTKLKGLCLLSPEFSRYQAILLAA